MCIRDSNQGARKEKAQAAIEIPAQDDAFNSIRREYADMLKNQDVYKRQPLHSADDSDTDPPSDRDS